MTQEEDQFAVNRQRMKILDAMVSAIERRHEVFELVERSTTADAARDGLAELLGVDDLCAVAILDMQARRFTQQERQRVVEERNAFRRHLG